MLKSHRIQRMLKSPLSSMSLLTPVCEWKPDQLSATPFAVEGLYMLTVFFMSSYHLCLYLYNFQYPLAFGDTKNKFNFCCLWQLAIQLFIHLFNRPLLSSNHMQALRTQRSKIPNHVLKNVTVYHIGPLQLLSIGKTHLFLLSLLMCHSSRLPCCSSLLNELELIKVP